MRKESPIKMPLSHAERFFPTKNNSWENFAPLTYGAPCNLISVEQKVFEKTKEERASLKEMKKDLPKTRNYSFEIQFKGAF